MSQGLKQREIAVIGGGIAGMGAAWQLAGSHNVTLFESAAYIGGHANTVDTVIDGDSVAVDTGFIVFNDRNYPNLTALFEALNVPVANSDMSFGASLNRGTLEYAGTDLGGLFAQRRNLVSPTFWRMLVDIKRFYGEAPRYLSTLQPDLSISDLLESEGYSEPFIEHHLMPMAAAIWSASRSDIADYPAHAFIRFFDNHGLLSLTQRPQWKSVLGGSREYVRRLLADRAMDINTKTPVRAVRRGPNYATVIDEGGHLARFDDVVIATHADHALQLLADASEQERQTLSDFRYSSNQAWLHQDPALMPHRRRAWSSWNYLQTSPDPARPLAVTYWMNRLQPLATRHDLFVTLNPETPPKNELTHGVFSYEHPIFTPATDRAQMNMAALQGVRNTWFCGAYLGHGFHEDGLQSGLWVADRLGAGQLLPEPRYDRLPESFLSSLAEAA